MKLLATVDYKDKNGEHRVSYNVAGYPKTNFEGKAFWMFMKFFYHNQVKKRSIKVRLV